MLCGFFLRYSKAFLNQMLSVKGMWIVSFYSRTKKQQCKLYAYMSEMRVTSSLGPELTGQGCHSN